ncbi:MAG TPA: MarR family transcriptional regulator [Polyangiaceae bacterium]|jgi:DNA-binding MarR family transcriptional regulator
MEQDQRLAYALVRTAKTYLRLSNLGLAELGLQQGQDALLRYVWARDGLPQSELVGCLSVEPPTVTKMLARLEKAGFVKRRRDPRFKKQWRVYLTAKGKQIEKDVQAHWTRMEARATHGLTAAEKRSFIETAARVRSNLIA